MKIANKLGFTLIEIICSIAILALAVGSLMITLNGSVSQVAVSNQAITACLLAEKKMATYQVMKWSEIPQSESGPLDKSYSSGLKYDMKSEVMTNDMGGFVHIEMTVYFPSADASDHEFNFITDIPLKPEEVEKDDSSMFNDNRK